MSCHPVNHQVSQLTFLVSSDLLKNAKFAVLWHDALNIIIIIIIRTVDRERKCFSKSRSKPQDGSNEVKDRERGDQRSEVKEEERTSASSVSDHSRLVNALNRNHLQIHIFPCTGFLKLGSLELLTTGNLRLRIPKVSVLRSPVFCPVWLWRHAAAATVIAAAVTAPAPVVLRVANWWKNSLSSQVSTEAH